MINDYNHSADQLSASMLTYLPAKGTSRTQNLSRVSHGCQTAHAQYVLTEKDDHMRCMLRYYLKVEKHSPQVAPINWMHAINLGKRLTSLHQCCRNPWSLWRISMMVIKSILHNVKDVQSDSPWWFSPRLRLIALPRLIIVSCRFDWKVIKKIDKTITRCIIRDLTWIHLKAIESVRCSLRFLICPSPDMWLTWVKHTVHRVENIWYCKFGKDCVSLIFAFSLGRKVKIRNA